MATRPRPPNDAATLAELASEPQATFAADGRLRWANPAWTERLGSAGDTLDALAASLAGDGAGAYPPFDRLDRPLPHEPGARAVFLRDVTREREAGRVAAAFLGRAAHQLRTPIAGIYGFAELMAGGRLSPERLAEAAGIVQRQSGSLVRLIDLLLDLARLESRPDSDLRWTTIDPVALLREAIEELPAARGPGRIRLPAAAPALRADRIWLRTALRELLDNACAYSAAEAAVDVSVEPSDAGVLLRIADRGRGIEPDAQARVFERFERAAGPDDPPGHGLGLALARDIARRLGGELSLSPRGGGGTEAVLSLPRPAY